MESSGCNIPPLGPVSEVQVILDSEQLPLSSISYLYIKGRPDVGALSKSVRYAQECFPQIASRLIERRHGLHYLLDRIPLEEPPPLKVLDALSESLGGKTRLRAISELMEPELYRKVDLFKEPPIKFYLAFLPDDHCALIVHFHHSGSDAGSMMVLYRTILARYHEMIVGTAPDWAGGEGMGAARAAGSPAKLKVIPVLRKMSADGKRVKKESLVKLAPKIEVSSPKRHMTKLEFNPDQTAKILAKARELKVTVNDLLCVAAMRAIDEIVESKDGISSMWIPVNLRSASGDSKWKANHVTSINVNLSKEQRETPKVMLQEFVKHRKQMLAMNVHEVNFILLKGLLWFARLFPFRFRTPYLKKIIEGQSMTFMVSNTGVMWPKRVGGKLTPGTYMDWAGNLEILKYEMNYFTNSDIGHGVVAYSFNGRFTVLFSAYDEVVTKQFATSFMDRIKGYLID